MKTTPLQIKFGLAALTVTFLTGCFGHLSQRANSDSLASKHESETGQTAEPTGKVAGIIVHIDPKTGEIIIPPARVLPGPVAQPSVDAIKKPLAEPRETPSPVGAKRVSRLSGAEWGRELPPAPLSVGNTERRQDTKWLRL